MSLFEPVAFAKGLAIGTAIAAPVGPMSLLCMRRTLTLGWRFGFGTGAGIATGDGVYASVAALGLVGVTRFMLAHERPLHAAAGLFLLYLGWRAFFSRSARGEERAAATSLWAAFASALLLTLTNPPTIVSFVAVFAALAPAPGFNSTSAFATVSGVFLGSLLWWLLVTVLVRAARRALGSRTRGWIDRISGAVLGVLGAAELRRAA